jgi:WD40 repeat protein
MASPAAASPSTALLTYTGHHNTLASIAWSPDGHAIVTGALDGTAQVWDARTAASLRVYQSQIPPAKSDDWVQSVSWSSDSKQILTCFVSTLTAQIFDVASGTMQASFTPASGATFMATGWSPNGKYIALGNSTSVIQIYAVPSNQLIATCTGQGSLLNAVSWSSDNTRVATTGSNVVAVWKATTGKKLLDYGNHRGTVNSISWSPDGTRVASAATDGTVQLWDAASGKTLYTYDKHQNNFLRAVAWSPDGTLIASGGSDQTTHVWEASSGKLLRSYPSLQIVGVAWSPDSTKIATADTAKVGAQVWVVK